VVHLQIAPAAIATLLGLDPEIWAGIIGAGLGAIFTAFGSWLISARLERSASYHRLVGALELVVRELQENSARIERHGDEVGDRLTLHDWATSKSALVGLKLRNEPLWEEVADAYGQIHETRGGNSPPDKALLDGLAQQLTDEQEAVQRKLERFSQFRRAIGRRLERFAIWRATSSRTSLDEPPRRPPGEEGQP
jgi:hypothetical protein